MQWEVPTFISEVVGTGALSITLFYIAKQIVIQSDQLKRSNTIRALNTEVTKSSPIYLTSYTCSERLCD